MAEASISDEHSNLLFSALSIKTQVKRKLPAVTSSNMWCFSSLESRHNWMDKTINHDWTSTLYCNLTNGIGCQKLHKSTNYSGTFFFLLTTITITYALDQTKLES